MGYVIVEVQQERSCVLENIMTENFGARISIDPEVCFGKPCIKGTRIPVYLILELIEAGYSTERIITECYPQLTADDIHSAVHYAVQVIKNEDIVFQVAV
jgi:uncharacterized protein (DUF433 family)